MNAPHKSQHFWMSNLKKHKPCLKDTEERPSVLFLGASSALSVAPAASGQTSLIEAGGGTNAVVGVDGTGSFIEVNIEQIVAGSRCDLVSCLL